MGIFRRVQHYRLAELHQIDDNGPQIPRLTPATQHNPAVRLQPLPSPPALAPQTRGHKKEANPDLIPTSLQSKPPLPLHDPTDVGLPTTVIKVESELHL